MRGKVNSIAVMVPSPSLAPARSLSSAAPAVRTRTPGSVPRVRVIVSASSSWVVAPGSEVSAATSRESTWTAEETARIPSGVTPTVGVPKRSVALMPVTVTGTVVVVTVPSPVPVVTTASTCPPTETPSWSAADWSRRMPCAESGSVPVTMSGCWKGWSSRTATWRWRRAEDERSSVHPEVRSATDATPGVPRSSVARASMSGESEAAGSSSTTTATPV